MDEPSTCVEFPLHLDRGWNPGGEYAGKEGENWIWNWRRRVRRIKSFSFIVLSKNYSHWKEVS